MDYEQDQKVYEAIRRDRFSVCLNLSKTCLKRFVQSGSGKKEMGNSAGQHGTGGAEEKSDEAMRSKFLEDGIRFARIALRVDRNSDRRHQVHYILAQTHRIKYGRTRIFSNLETAKKAIETAIELVQHEEGDKLKSYRRELTTIDSLLAKQSKKDTIQKSFLMKKALGSLYQDQTPDDEWERMLREDEENERSGKKLWTAIGPGNSNWYIFEGGRSHGKAFRLEQEETEAHLSRVTVEKGFAPVLSDE